MAITQKSIKILWAAAGGRCSFEGCKERLCYHEAAEAAPYLLGEMAHICGEKPGASRHNAEQTDVQRDHYQNLMLLCPTHHTLIDREENEAVFTVEILHSMKAAHEAAVMRRLDVDPQPTKGDVTASILPILEENRQSWAQYGPLSELARTQPHNEAAHAVWLSERLSVIVPNNRKIAEQLVLHRGLFAAAEQAAISAFLLHARGYEQWVEDTIPYAAVKRFPAEFDSLVRGDTDGGA
ncbi:HNH endonuclease [Devosia sp. LjRoot3]|uniref:HNH endonuclease n=1 Tax=Devosia sp. LjRoot3 TaxID=3342319 RepID=UPI003ECEA4AA